MSLSPNTEFQMGFQSPMQKKQQQQQQQITCLSFLMEVLLVLETELMTTFL